MSTKRTALTRLTTLFHSYDARGNDLALDEAQQGLLADILSLPCLQDEQFTNDEFDVAMYCETARNELRAEVRQEITVYFMGGDVGVDMGSNFEENNMKCTAVEHIVSDDGKTCECGYFTHE